PARTVIRVRDGSCGTSLTASASAARVSWGVRTSRTYSGAAIHRWLKPRLSEGYRLSPGRMTVVGSVSISHIRLRHLRASEHRCGCPSAFLPLRNRSATHGWRPGEPVAIAGRGRRGAGGHTGTEGPAPGHRVGGHREE